MDFKFKKSNLNFRVYTSETKPIEPGLENDIAIITSVPMPNWILSPDEPSGAPRSDGDVWIKYSVDGSTFNALKQGFMMIATISAWQYVDGAWVNVPAKSCQNGQWVDWIPKGALYYNGLQNVPWIEKPSVGWAMITPTFSSDHILLSGGASGQNTISGVVTQDKVDVSGYSSLTVEFEDVNDLTANAAMYVQISNIQTDTWDVKNSIACKTLPTNQNSITLEFSDTGSYYICIFAMRTVSAKIKRVVLS